MTFTVLPDPLGGVVLRHLLAMRARGPALLTWPLVFRPLHEALLEDALDRAERELTGTVLAPARWGVYTRVLRRLFRRRGSGRATPRGANDRTSA